MEPIGLQRDELWSNKEDQNGCVDVMHPFIENLKIKQSFAECCIPNVTE